MSKGLGTLVRGAALAVCVGSISMTAAVEAQQLQTREGQPLPQQDLKQMWEQQRSQMRDHMASAMQNLRGACQDELRNFCGTVTPGEGRVLLCMQAHEDKLSRQCEMALLETSRDIGHAIRRVERFAQACLSDIKVHCSTAGGSVTKCMVENRAALSPQCRAIVAATQAAAQPAPTQPGQTQPGQTQPGQTQPGQTQPGQTQPGQTQPGQTQQDQTQQPTMTGLAVYSTDGMKLGEVTGVRRAPDGSVESIEADLGSPLGLGATGVLISTGDLRWKGDHVELQMAGEEVRTILQQQGQRR
jgi:Cysteine rich repeat/PRC-barrel domain